MLESFFHLELYMLLLRYILALEDDTTLYTLTAKKNIFENFLNSSQNINNLPDLVSNTYKSFKKPSDFFYNMLARISLNRI